MKQFALTITLCMMTWFLVAQSIDIWGEIFPPFGYEIDGERAGMTTEIVNYLVEDSGVQVNKWYIAPWARAFAEGKSKPNTLLYTVTRKPDREDLFHWIGPICDRSIQVYKLKTRNDIVVNSWEDVNNYCVGSLRNASSTETLESHDVIPEKTSTLKQLVKMLIANRIDLINILDSSLAYLANEEGVSMSEFESVMVADESKQFYIALNINTSPQIVESFQKSFETMKKNGELQKILSKYKLTGQ